MKIKGLNKRQGIIGVVVLIANREFGADEGKGIAMTPDNDTCSTVVNPVRATRLLQSGVGLAKLDIHPYPSPRHIRYTIAEYPVDSTPNGERWSRAAEKGKSRVSGTTRLTDAYDKPSSPKRCRSYSI